MTESLSIFALTVNEWNYPWWVDRQHLLSRLAARGWPVVYSNGPLSLWDRNSRLWKISPWFSRVEHIPVVGERSLVVDHPGRIFPLWPRHNRWNNFVQRRYARRLLELNGDSSPEQRIAFVCYPTFLPYVNLLNPKWVVLHINDAWNKFPGWSSHLQGQLEELADRADLITCINSAMAEQLPESVSGKVKILPHGVDAASLMRARNETCPEDLAQIPRPRIGYMGRVSRKIDLELVASIAHQRPDWHWVFIGTVGTGFGDDKQAWKSLSACQACENIHFLGWKSMEELPLYLWYIDAHALCYKINEDGFWTSVFPLKTYECLMTGKPIVASDIRSLHPFSSVIDLARTPQDWIKALERALAGDGVGSVDERQQLALDNTWEQRADTLDRWLKEMVETQKLKG